MHTHNERTVPSPERDELEKFIHKRSLHICWYALSYEEVENEMNEIASFSARRAREKAIEDFHKIILEESEGLTDYVKGVITIRLHTAMKKLKSPTN